MTSFDGNHDPDRGGRGTRSHRGERLVGAAGARLGPRKTGGVTVVLPALGLEEKRQLVGQQGPRGALPSPRGQRTGKRRR